MIQVLGESSSREELEQRFVSQYAPWARTWPMERVARVTHWTNPGNTVRIQVVLEPHEYLAHPTDAAGMIGDCIRWDENILKRHEDGSWRPSALIRLKKTQTKKIKARRPA